MANTTITSTAADTAGLKPVPGATHVAPPESETFLCSIHNPTIRPRNIFDGIKNDKPIHIEPGQTVQAVLSSMMIDRLQEAEEKAAPEPMLKVSELGPPPPPPPPRAARRPRPAATATA